MVGESSQKFIARNRAPRVQIEYDVEMYGAAKKIQLPFIMGVLADLSGKPADPLAPVADRKFLEIDVDNFDDRLKAMKPRVAFTRAEHAHRRGQARRSTSPSRAWTISLPDAIARKVEPLRQLLEAREQLSNLLTYMDGKAKAEELVAKLLQDPALMRGPGRGAKPDGASGAGLRPAETRRRASDHGRDRGPARAPRRPPAAEAAGAGRLPVAAASKEFRPRTQEAEARIQRRRAHPGRAGAAPHTRLFRTTRSRPIQAIIAQLDQKLTEQVNLILHHPDFQELEGAWRGLHYLVNNTETDRDAQDPGDEHLQEGAGQERSRSSRAPPGIRARSSRRSTPTNIRCSAASRSAAWSATTTSTTAPGTSALLRQHRERLRGGAHAVHLRARADACSAWRAGRS